VGPLREILHNDPNLERSPLCKVDDSGLADQIDPRGLSFCVAAAFAEQTQQSGWSARLKRLSRFDPQRPPVDDSYAAAQIPMRGVFRVVSAHSSGLFRRNSPARIEWLLAKELSVNAVACEATWSAQASDLPTFRYRLQI
jgi:hypothetical protein